MSRKERNEVFGKPPGISSEQAMQESFGFEIPVENAPLPSLGLVYDSDSALYNSETVQIRAMTAKEEDILTSRAYIKDGTVISKLIESCAVERFSANELLVGDRNALMVAIRVTGYGAEYDVKNVECPLCNEKSDQNFNLSELEINRLKIEPVDTGKNIFEFTLPMTKKKVQFKFLTGKDEQEMNTASERKRKKGFKSEDTVTTRLFRSVVAVDGNTDRSKISLFVKNLPAYDSLQLRKHIEKNEPGINMTSWMSCPHCFEESEVRMPLGASFFWPES